MACQQADARHILFLVTCLRLLYTCRNMSALFDVSLGRTARYRKLGTGQLGTGVSVVISCNL